MQRYKNVINPCLIRGELEQEVLELLPLPELHILMGVTNWGYKLVLKVWPALVFWARGKWTVHRQYGGALNGANSNR